MKIKRKTVQHNKTNDLSSLICPEHGVTMFLDILPTYQTARCHNQDNADIHRHCRHNLITSQLRVQFGRAVSGAGLRPPDYRYRGFESC